MASTLKTGPSTSGLQVLAIPGVVLLVSFLGYSSQWLFNSAADLGPGPLTKTQTVVFNALLLNLWWNYYKACTVNPGTYILPNPSSDEPSSSSSATDRPSPPPADPTDDAKKPGQKQTQSSRREQRERQLEQLQRWCKKCAAPKPPRAHHCRHCRRCIPKMDHHCPWTGNCVSMQTFPYFLRFLASTNAALWYLGRLAYLRLRGLYDVRNLPAYLGPPTWALAHLTCVSLVCAGVFLALGILLATTAKAWVLNRTMIEDWEVERHEALLARHGVGGRRSTWWATDDDDDETDASGGGSESELDEDDTPVAGMPTRRVEFPYDIGVWGNMCQAMGTRNPLAWFFPFSGGPVVSAAGRGPGWDWEENGFNRREGMWPPPDPEKLRHVRQGGWPARRNGSEGDAVTAASCSSPEDMKAAFRARQERDLLRRRKGWSQQPSGIIAELEEHEGLEVLDGDYPGDQGGEVGDEDGGYYEQGMDGEPGWTNADGDRLRDFGVDEDAEEEDDVPIAELLRRRRAATQDKDT
ncbi:hypothetical protein RB601_009838 [Gaeumannomyces tritici]